MSKAADDLIAAFKMREIWAYLAVDDVLARYKRTVLGPLWNTAYIVFTSISLSVVFGALFRQPLKETLPYILSGMIAWNLLSLQILDSAGMFTTYAGTVKVTNFPFFFYVMRNVARTFLFFLHNIVALLVISLCVGHIPLIHWSVIPALILGIVITIPYSMLTGMAGARYRDLLQFFTNLTGLLFFLTPIFWHPEGITGVRKLIYQVNPFYYIVEVVRLPLLDIAPSLVIWEGSAIILVVGVLVCAVFFSRYRSRISYWV